MKKLLCLSAALLAFGGCDRGDQGGENQSVEEVARAMAAVKMQPGQWEATNEILSAKAPGIPDEALRRMVGQKTTVSNCVTPEQAARPSANFLAAQKDSDCTYQDFSMEGGRMKGVMTCTSGPMPGKMVMNMNGRYEPRTYDMNMKMNVGDMPGGMTMTIEARTTGRRVGECTSEAGVKK